jgi:REP element-mobilizing transposase RayT
MARRLNIRDIPQHVTQRGNNRQACFFTNADRYKHLELLHQSSICQVCSVHAYVLMNNHPIKNILRLMKLITQQTFSHAPNSA